MNKSSQHKQSRTTRATNTAKKPAHGPAEGATAPSIHVPDGADARYAQYLPFAQALPSDKVIPAHDVELANINIQAAVPRILQLRDRIRRELPEAKLEDIISLPELSIAMLFAASRVDPTSDGKIQADLAKMRKVAAAMRYAARALAAEGVFDRVAVEKIVAGRGTRSAVQELVDLAALFTARWDDAAGKVPFTKAQVREAAVLGASLKKRIKPRNAPRVRGADFAAAIDVRDRFWTLVSTRYEMLRRVAAWLFGMDPGAERVPPLQSHARTVHRTRGSNTTPVTTGTAAPNTLEPANTNAAPPAAKATAT